MEPSVQQLERAYDEYAESIFRHCYFRTRDRERSKELMQETFMKTWEYMANGKEIRSLKAFLFRVASNLVINEVTRRKQLASLEELHERLGFEPATEAADPASAVDSTLVLKRLQRLPESYRVILIMRYIDELSIKDIAKALNKTENNISVHIHRALEALRHQMEGA